MGANRHVGAWGVALHSFEEYLHSPSLSQSGKSFSLQSLLHRWTKAVPGASVFELYQQPMGGPQMRSARSIISRWVYSREGVEGSEHRSDDDNSPENPFAWIADPLNTLQTAVHYAQPRAEAQGIVEVPSSTLRVNHYVNVMSTTPRCSCHVR